MDEKIVRDAHATFNEAFEADVSWETFQHKHMAAPESIGESEIIVDYADGTPRGMNGFMPLTLLIGAHPLRATFSCDIAVRPAYRGQHIFYRMIKRAIEQFQTEDMDLIYAMPNQNSYHGFQKLEFCELGKFAIYARILRPVELLFRKAMHRSAEYPPFSDTQFHVGSYLYSISTSCPFSDADISAINGRTSIHFYRSRAFYQWKFDDLSKGDRAYLCARTSENELVGFLLVQKSGSGAIDICDWMLPREQAAAGAILRTCCKFLRSFCDVVQGFVNPSNWEPQVFSAGGFFRRRIEQPFLIMPTSELASADACPELYDFRNWEVRKIDSDTILNG